VFYRWGRAPADRFRRRSRRNVGRWPKITQKKTEERDSEDSRGWDKCVRIPNPGKTTARWESGVEKVVNNKETTDIARGESSSSSVGGEGGGKRGGGKRCIERSRQVPEYQKFRAGILKNILLCAHAGLSRLSKFQKKTSRQKISGVARRM